ncbi:MAG: ATP-binding protein [Candidatus Acidiferrum sp.]
MSWSVIALDEVGYVPLAEIGAEFLFQVIAERAERATLIVTTNLPFSEWTQVFPNPRLCKALLDRVTDRAHIIETGTESYRFRRTVEGRQKKKNFVTGRVGRYATRRRGPGVRSVLNAVLKTGPQDSTPSGATERNPRKKRKNNGLRVGQMKVSKVGQIRLSKALGRLSCAHR